MTTEQLKELSEALSILSSKSSVLKERDELRALMEENLQAEEVSYMTLLTCIGLNENSRTQSLPLVHLRSAFGLCLPRSMVSCRNTTVALEILCR